MYTISCDVDDKIICLKTVGKNGQKLKEPLLKITKIEKICICKKGVRIYPLYDRVIDYFELLDQTKKMETNPAYIPIDTFVFYNSTTKDRLTEKYESMVKSERSV